MIKRTCSLRLHQRLRGSCALLIRFQPSDERTFDFDRTVRNSWGWGGVVAWVRNWVCIYSGSDWAFWAVKSVGGLWFLRLCRWWFCLVGFILFYYYLLLLLLLSNQWFLKRWASEDFLFCQVRCELDIIHNSAIRLFVGCVKSKNCFYFSFKNTFNKI